MPIPAIIAPIPNGETWEDHFLNNSNNTIQDQIDAGFPYYIQPMEAVNPGVYEEYIDYGSVINSVIVNLDWDEQHIISGASVSVSISHSLDGLSWSTPAAGSSLYIASFRYLRVRFEIVGTASGIVIISNLRVVLDIKRATDSGSITALSSDVGGTTVTFNLTFADINSLTATAQNPTEPITVIYDFVDLPYPTSFKVFAFDSTGKRVTHLVSWVARGSL